jgi:thiol-disulfide isomerase/thioredoxin
MPALPLTAAALAAALALLASSAPPPAGDAPAKDPAPPKESGKAKGKGKPAAKSESDYYAKLSPEDREALAAVNGYLVPQPPADLVWIGGDPMTREDFAGKVTVIQSVSGKPSPRLALEKLKKTLPEGVELIGLHTPDGAERAKASLETNPPCRIAIDSSGKWCDALGVWTTPVNIVVSRTGVVSEVGLTEDGFQAKLPLLLAAPDDTGIDGPERPAEPGTPAEAAPAIPADQPKWPAPAGDVGGAQDRQGQKLADFAVDKWISPRPDPGTRLIAIDFWATWCAPCVQSIPKLEELAAKHADDLLVVGVSSEAEKAFFAGLKKLKRKAEDFRYPLGIDPSKKVSGFFGVKSIPYMAILSPDLVVRWQGHPAGLDDATVAQLVAANRAASKPAAGTGSGGRGWANRKPQKSR